MISGLFVLALVAALAYKVDENEKLKQAQKGGKHD